MEEIRLRRGGERDSLRSVSIATAESRDAGLTVPAKAVRRLHGRVGPCYSASIIGIASQGKSSSNRNLSADSKLIPVALREVCVQDPFS